MATLRPFPGWRFDPHRLEPGAVLAPAGALTETERRRLHRAHPQNVVRLLDDRPALADGPGHNAHTRAAAHLEAWREAELLYHDKPALYLIEQEFELRGQKLRRRGVLARLLLEEPGAGSLRLHAPLPERSEGRRLARERRIALRGEAAPLPVLLADPNAALARSLAGIANWEPTLAAPTPEGGMERLWVLDKPDLFGPFCDLAQNARAFLTGGLDRWRAAIDVRNETREALKAAGFTPPALGELEADWAFVFCLPLGDESFAPAPVHCLLHDMPDFDADRLLEGCRARFRATESTAREMKRALEEPGGLPRFGLAAGKRVYTLELTDEAALAEAARERPEAWRSLDAAALQRLLLEPLLGLDAAALLAGERVTASENLEAPARAKREGGAVQAAFFLRPPAPAAVRACLEAGGELPPLSVHYPPALRAGLVLDLHG